MHVKCISMQARCRRVVAAHALVKLSLSCHGDVSSASSRGPEQRSRPRYCEARLSVNPGRPTSGLGFFLSVPDLGIPSLHKGRRFFSSLKILGDSPVPTLPFPLPAPPPHPFLPHPPSCPWAMNNFQFLKLALLLALGTRDGYTKM